MLPYRPTTRKYALLVIGLLPFAVTIHGAPVAAQSCQAIVVQNCAQQHVNDKKARTACIRQGRAACAAIQPKRNPGGNVYKPGADRRGKPW